MKQSIFVGYVIALLLALILGCTGIPLNHQGTPFNLDQNFTITQGKTYSNLEQSLTLSDISIKDSRCPKDALIQCVWEGELGVELTVSRNNATAPVYLGLITNRELIVLNAYTLTLLAVDPDTNTATVRVSIFVPDDTPEVTQEWYSISPKQCQSNEWNAWATETGIMIKKSPDTSIDEALIPIWLKEKYGLIVYETKARLESDIVCEACSCPTGEAVVVLVDANSGPVLSGLGFTALGPIACTMDAKVCPDGSAVGREGPFCEFAACPVVATKEISIIKRNIPGFVIEPEMVTTTIDNEGTFTITRSVFSRDGGEPQEFIQRGSITSADLDELVSLIASGNFFSISEADAQMCIADIPTVELDITLGERHNVVSNIGAVCDENKIADAKNISERITALIEKTAVETASGIEGTVLIGPTCPVMQYPSQEQCADKGYASEFKVLSVSNSLVTTFSSDADGNFSVSLSPGTYHVELAVTNTLPSFAPRTIVVNAHEYTRVTLSVDSGIR